MVKNQGFMLSRVDRENTVYSPPSSLIYYYYSSPITKFPLLELYFRIGKVSNMLEFHRNGFIMWVEKLWGCEKSG